MESDSSATAQARSDDIAKCSVGLDLLLSADMCTQWPGLRARRRALLSRSEGLEREPFQPLNQCLRGGA
eukprot:1286755-Alexandrium_andersonii.AAC.1